MLLRVGQHRDGATDVVPGGHHSSVLLTTPKSAAFELRRPSSGRAGAVKDPLRDTGGWPPLPARTSPQRVTADRRRLNREAGDLTRATLAHPGGPGGEVPASGRRTCSPA